MVDGHDSEQQNRSEKKIFGVAPQFLYGEKCRDHLGSRAKAPTELFIGRVTRFVLRTNPTERPSAACYPPLLPMRTTSALDIHNTRGPWWLSSHEKSHHAPGKPEHSRSSKTFNGVSCRPDLWFGSPRFKRARSCTNNGVSEQWNLIPPTPHIFMTTHRRCQTKIGTKPALPSK